MMLAFGHEWLGSLVVQHLGTAEGPRVRPLSKAYESDRGAFVMQGIVLQVPRLYADVHCFVSELRLLACLRVPGPTTDIRRAIILPSRRPSF